MDQNLECTSCASSAGQPITAPARLTLDAADGSANTEIKHTAAVRMTSEDERISADIEAWFAVTTKPLYERFVGEALAHRGLSSFVPCYRSHRRWSDRVQKVDVPLFKGYVFG